MSAVEPRGLGFWIGVALIAASFSVYPSFPAIALLPISAEARLAGSFAAWALSWLVFLAGAALAGRGGIEYLKELVVGLRR